jgi:hypothetical protein
MMAYKLVTYTAFVEQPSNRIGSLRCSERSARINARGLGRDHDDLDTDVMDMYVGKKGIFPFRNAGRRAAS